MKQNIKEVKHVCTKRDVDWCKEMLNKCDHAASRTIYIIYTGLDIVYHFTNLQAKLRRMAKRGRITLYQFDTRTRTSALTNSFLTDKNIELLFHCYKVLIFQFLTVSSVKHFNRHQHSSSPNIDKRVLSYFFTFMSFLLKFNEVRFS